MDIIKSVVVFKSDASIDVGDLRSILTLRFEEPEECFLNYLENEIDSDNYKECGNKACGCVNDGNAIFCKLCGTKIENDGNNIAINQLEWNGGEESCETFNSIFLKEIVPHIKGTINGWLEYGDPYDTAVDYHGIGFKIVDGTFTFCDVELVPTQNVPKFNVNDPEEVEDDDDIDDDESYEEESEC